MSQRNIDFGAFPDDPNADAIRSAFEKVQLNFTEVFAGLGDQAVTSVNKTAGSGITVNQPTGNVVLEANIANVRIQSSTLDLGLGTQQNLTDVRMISSLTQSIVIDLPSTFATASGDFGYILANTLSGNGNINANNITLSNNITGVGGVFTYVSGNGANLTAIAGANVTGTVAFATTANAVAGANVSGAVTYATTANAVAGANVSGTVASATSAASANAVAGANVSGAVAFATTANAVAGANVSGEVTNAATANAVAGANVSGTVSSATTAGTVTTNAQPNITSVGTLSVLGVNGIITASNITANTGLFTGDGGGLSNIAGGNVGLVANATYAVSAGSATLAGTVTTAGQPNITSVGTLSALSVTGNASAGNVSGTGGVFTYVTGDGANLSSLPGANVTGAVSFATTANSVAGANVSGAVAVANAVSGSNVSGAVAFATTANAVAGANVSGQVANALVAGTVYTNAQPNITSTGTLTSLAVTGNVTTGNVSGTGGVFTYISGDGANLTNISVGAGSKILNGTSNVDIPSPNGNISVSVGGLTDRLIITTTGTNVAGTLSVTGIANIANIQTLKVDGTSNLGPQSNVTITGGVAGAFLKTNGSGSLTWDTGTLNPAQGADTQVIFNDGGTTYNGNTGFTFNKTTGVVAIAGNVTANNISGTLVTGTLATAAQPNITSVGTLTTLILSGNLNTNSDLITNAGNITIAGGTGTFIGNGGGLTNLPGANVSGAVALATSATSANAVAGANVSGAVTFATTANAVAGANVSGAVALATFSTTANAVAGANVSGTVALATSATSATSAASANAVAGANVSGAVAFATTANAVAGANVSGTVASATLATYATTANAVAGANVSGAVSFATTANAVAGANVSGTVASATLATFATTANAVAGGNVSGAVSFATTANAVAGANVSGTVALATKAGTITTNAQPNITSVGTLTVLGVNGIITASNITANTGLFTGDGGGLGNIAGGNVSLVANATYATSAGSSTLAGTVTTAAQPNITSVGTLTTLGVSGTITTSAVTANTGIFTGNGSGLTSITGANITGTVSSATTAGTVTTAAQPNITSVGTLIRHSTTDNISASGSTQGDATQLASEINRVTSASGTSGVKLPNAESGLMLIVINTSANNLNVYPNTSDQINSLSVNGGLVHPSGATLQYICTNATNWYTVGATYA